LGTCLEKSFCYFENKNWPFSKALTIIDAHRGEVNVLKTLKQMQQNTTIMDTYLLGKLKIITQKPQRHPLPSGLGTFAHLWIWSVTLSQIKLLHLAIFLHYIHLWNILMLLVALVSSMNLSRWKMKSNSRMCTRFNWNSTMIKQSTSVRQN
jgi:hypothetical protein